MPSYLYAVRFSSGLVKVGRSDQPDFRIAGHVDRVAAAGLTCEARHIAPCVGNAQAAEARLIARCVQAGTARHLKEWFRGLDFALICDWLDTEAAAPPCAAERTHSFRPVIDGRAAAASAYFFCRACSRAEVCEGSLSAFVCNDCFAAGYRFEGKEGLRCEGTPVPLWSATDSRRNVWPGVSCEELRPDACWVRLFDRDHALGRPLLDPSPDPAPTDDKIAKLVA